MSKLNMQQYLESSEFIDWADPEVMACAELLTRGLVFENDIVNACFKYVRDQIKHSADYEIDIVTCKASDVLRHKTGYCYAKSHLLASLLRANGIPAGLCYQRLSLNGGGEPYILHGLNAVYLQDFGWYRVDARGNKASVDAQFMPPKEQLAFSVSDSLEADIQGIFSEPVEGVVSVLQRYNSYKDVDDNLPDIDVL